MQSREKDLRAIYELVERIIHNPLHDDNFRDRSGKKYLPIIEIDPSRILNAEAGLYQTKNKKKLAIKVTIYQGAIDVCSEKELEALCAHELSHISNEDYNMRDWIYIATGIILGSISLLGIYYNPLIGWPLLATSFVFASYSYKKLYQARERIADIHAAHIAGRTATISLLKKLAQGRPYSLIERIFAMMEHHPHWQDRIKLIESLFPEEEETFEPIELPSAEGI